MENLAEIEKSIQEIGKKIESLGDSKGEAHSQGMPGGAGKRLVVILLAFLAGAGSAGFAAYYHLVITARTEMLNKFSMEALPDIKQKIMSVMEKEALGSLPEIQRRVESRLNGRLDLMMKRLDSQLNALDKDQGKRPDQKLATPTKVPVPETPRTEGSNTQQGWSFYGIQKDSKWTMRFFDPANAQDTDAMPSIEATIVSRGAVNIRKDPPSYSPDTGWSYASASVIGGVQKSEQAKVNKVTSVDTSSGNHVWVKLSPIKP